MYDIKDLRSKTGKNQFEFSKWLKIPIKTLQKWEQGVSSPPSYVLDLIEYKIFMTFMVSSSAPESVQSEFDYKALFDLMDNELEIQPRSSIYCIYRPESGGCHHCTLPEDEDCSGLYKWSRYKEFCPD